MAYTYRFYRFDTHSAFLAAWAEAGLPLEDGAPFLPAGALDEIGATSTPGEDPEGTPEPVPGWHVNVAWPAEPPDALAAYAITPFEGLRVFAGWEHAAPPGPSGVPTQATNFQIRAALMREPGVQNPEVTLFDEVNGALLAGRNGTPEGEQAWQAWEFANDFMRAGVLVNAMADAFGKDAAWLDQLFVTAAQIEA